MEKDLIFVKVLLRKFDVTQVICVVTSQLLANESGITGTSVFVLDKMGLI